MPCKVVFLHYLITVVSKVRPSTITKNAKQFMFTKSLQNGSTLDKSLSQCYYKCLTIHVENVSLDFELLLLPRLLINKYVCK